jgi:Ca2+-binding EF-hand superfamily protein
MPEVILRKVDKAKATRSFIDSFARDQRGLVSKETFLEVMTDLSNSIPSDENFAYLVGIGWGIKEDATLKVDPQYLKSIIKEIRLKLLTLTTGSEDEYMLRKLFKDFDLNNSNLLTIDELKEMIKKMGLTVTDDYLQEIFRIFDQNGNGVIEFEEFNNYILYDPYR